MGLLSFIPLVGLSLAGLGIWIGLKIRRESKATWNPARRYALAGICLGLLSLVLQVGLAFFLGAVGN